MTKTLLVDVRELTDSQRATIADAARARGFRAAFASNEAEAEAVAPEAEILFSLNAALLKNAPKLKWWCVPYAGVDAFLKPALEDRRDILLSSSSGAYGVTIAEHIVMVTLMLMRRQMEYTEVVRNGGWRRDLPIRAIRGSRIAVLGAGDIGREAAVRLRAFGPASVVGVNRSAARLSGINAQMVIFIVFALTGFLSGISGLIYSSRIMSNDSNNAGLNYEMDAILAVVIGGTSMTGGKFSLAGTVLGSIIIRTIVTLVYYFGIASEATMAFKAVIIAVVIVLQSEPVREAFAKRTRARAELAKGGAVK